MPTPTRGPRLGGSPNHERLILRNLAQSLFEHGKITTTEAKAKRLRPFAEKLITSAKRGDLHARREVLKVIRDKEVVHKLFAEIGPSFSTRDGGYTRIIKTAPRKGDNAPMAIIELIGEETVSAVATRTTNRAARTRASQSAAPAATAISTAPADTAAGAANDEAALEAGETPAEDVTSAQTESAAAEEPAEGADDASADTTGAEGAEATEAEK